MTYGSGPLALCERCEEIRDGEVAEPHLGPSDADDRDDGEEMWVRRTLRAAPR